MVPVWNTQDAANTTPVRANEFASGERVHDLNLGAALLRVIDPVAVYRVFVPLEFVVFSPQFPRLLSSFLSAQISSISYLMSGFVRLSLAGALVLLQNLKFTLFGGIATFPGLTSQYLSLRRSLVLLHAFFAGGRVPISYVGSGFGLVIEGSKRLDMSTLSALFFHAVSSWFIMRVSYAKRVVNNKLMNIAGMKTCMESVVSGGGL
jgi:hypothetical protein